MRSGAKLVGVIVGIVCVLAIVVVACVYKDDIVDYSKKIKNRLARKEQ